MYNTITGNICHGYKCIVVNVMQFNATFIQHVQVSGKYKKIRCGMIVNETTFHKRPNDTDLYNYRPLHGL